jgi:hypothetical protein
MTSQELVDTFASLPDEAQRLIEDFIAFVRQRYPVDASSAAPPSDLEKEEFFGMWRDREDMKDSSAWVRKVRETEWG